MFADPGLPIEIIAMPEVWTNVTWHAMRLSLHLYLAFCHAST